MVILVFPPSSRETMLHFLGGNCKQKNQGSLFVTTTHWYQAATCSYGKVLISKTNNKHTVNKPCPVASMGLCVCGGLSVVV